MKRDEIYNRSRRSFLKKAAAATGATAISVLTLTSSEAFAAKAPKKSVQYQDKPKNGQMCAKCKFYIPSKSGGKGKCQVVQGAIDPKGWCSVFQAKS